MRGVLRRSLRCTVVAVLAVMSLWLLSATPALAGSCPGGGDHVYKGAVTRPHTGSTDGVIAYTCTKCGDSYTVPMPKGHVWAEISRSGPTCTEGEVIVRRCTVCGETQEQAGAVALGHEWGAWVTDAEASCTTDGMRHRACAHEASHLEYEIIPATGHAWGAWETVRAATETEAGTERRVCANDATHVQERTIPAPGGGSGTGRSPAEVAETPAETTEDEGPLAPSEPEEGLRETTPAAPADAPQAADAGEGTEDATEPWPEHQELPFGVLERAISDSKRLVRFPRIKLPLLRLNAFDIAAGCIDLGMIAGFALAAYPLVMQVVWIERRRRMALGIPMGKRRRRTGEEDEAA